MEEKQKSDGKEKNKSNNTKKSLTKKSSEFNIDDILQKILTSRK